MILGLGVAQALNALEISVAWTNGVCQHGSTWVFVKKKILHRGPIHFSFTYMGFEGRSSS